MIITLGAIVSAYLGFRLYEIWVPAAVACAVVALQFLSFRSGANDVGLELYIFSFILGLFLFYATYGIGRAVGQRRKAKR